MYVTAKLLRWIRPAALILGPLWFADQPSSLAATVEAYAGVPFGVARVTLPVVRDQPVVPLEDERFTVSSANGRVLYPVLKEEPVRRLLRRFLEIETPRSVTMYFVFTGDGPLEVELFSPLWQTATVVPRIDAAGHRRLMNEWWEQYVSRWKKLRQDPQFPPVVENFLAANLARRLGRELPAPNSGLLSLFAAKKTTWDEVLGSERHQLAIDQALLAGAVGAPGAPQPLPPPMPWYDEPAPDAELEGVAVEPIARHVPVECFYVRFGTFTNYLWFRDLNKKWQGDLGNMITRRSIDRPANERIEQQLALRESGLAKILGPQVIEDVAMIGLDPYLAQGAAVGILFQAKNNLLLSSDLVSQRREALKKFPGATETTVKIADRDVSLIAAPSREVHSYYVQDGDLHLVATSQRLVQKFLQAGKSEQSLVDSTGFLRARQRLPLERGDAIFAYISPEFFRGLTAPAAWIESQRRLRSLREAKLIALARLQAAAEGTPAATVAELIAAGILPAGFGTRGDGSELSAEADAGSAIDSRRGRAGWFIPVADMDVESVTPAEAAAYQAFVARFKQETGQTPPIAVGVQRKALADGSGETLSADLFATPLADVKLGRLPDMMGEPSGERVGPVDGDLIRAELVLNAPLPLAAAEPHHLFLGVRDFRSPLVARQGKLAPGAPPAELVRMYLGAWPRPGLTRLFLNGLPADGADPVPASQDAWQAKRDEFLLMSFKPDLIREVLPQLVIVPVEPAQAWLDVRDLTGTELSGTVSAIGYMRTREASVAACRLMNTLVNQLRVPAEGALDTAQQLMDGRFTCPLGGEYELVEIDGGGAAWTSSALAPANRFLFTAPPEDFELPLLTWFKGLRGALRLEKDELSAHVEIDMAASAVP
jgi:hypothetical protein